MGNKSCFRNEIHNRARFVWKPEWTLPKTGTFEFDFISLVTNRPTEAEMTTPQQFELLMKWFVYMQGDNKRKDDNFEDAMAEAFRSVAEFFAFSTE